MADASHKTVFILTASKMSIVEGTTLAFISVHLSRDGAHALLEKLVYLRRHAKAVEEIRREAQRLGLSDDGVEALSWSGVITLNLSAAPLDEAHIAPSRDVSTPHDAWASVFPDPGGFSPFPNSKED